MPPIKVHSGLQLQVLSLYKKALQEGKHKDADTLHFVRERFREDAASVDRKDFVVIEYMLRKGERDLKMLNKMKNDIPSVKSPTTVNPITSESFVAELEPEFELGPKLPLDELETWDELLVDLYRSAEELSAEVDVLVDVDEVSDEVEDPVELSEASKDKLMDASMDVDEEVVKVLPELERDSGSLELEDEEEERRSVLADSDELELVGMSNGREPDESSAETEPAVEEDESRAVTPLIATVARMRTWNTFIVGSWWTSSEFSWLVD